MASRVEPRDVIQAELIAQRQNLIEGAEGQEEVRIDRKPRLLKGYKNLHYRERVTHLARTISKPNTSLVEGASDDRLKS